MIIHGLFNLMSRMTSLNWSITPGGKDLCQLRWIHKGWYRKQFTFLILQILRTNGGLSRPWIGWKKTSPMNSSWYTRIISLFRMKLQRISGKRYWGNGERKNKNKPAFCWSLHRFDLDLANVSFEKHDAWCSTYPFNNRCLQSTMTVHVPWPARRAVRLRRMIFFVLFCIKAKKNRKTFQINLYLLSFACAKEGNKEKHSANDPDSYRDSHWRRLDWTSVLLLTELNNSIHRHIPKLLKTKILLRVWS